jgi:ABC-type nitrate/sulfonate/bicarbonate transport system ATPase subunit
MSPKIVVRGATKTFNVAVLDHVDLEVSAGEFVAIVGPSGCGKSTLLHALAGFVPLDSGDIAIDGVPVHRPTPRRIYMFQEPSVFPWFTVSENIAIGLDSLDAAERRRVVAEHVELVVLHGFENAYPRELSGGMKQRLEFARALAVDPDVLFLDEPFGALDAITRFEMRREIARIWAANRKTCVLVTHDVEEACELADRVVVLSRRPARVLENIPIALERPRDIDGTEFRSLKTRIRELLRTGAGGRA